jgi:N6-adenosine-specific RNA methylase IME4
VIKYRTILADPPWAVEQKGNLGASRHYAVLSTQTIATLPIHLLAEDKAHLWMWATNSALDEQIGVMEAWGFEYRAALTWIKPYFTLGQYLRHQTEHLLFGTRGRLPIQFRRQGSWFYAPLQDHSHKPEESNTPSSSAVHPARELSCLPAGSNRDGTQWGWRLTVATSEAC